MPTINKRRKLSYLYELVNLFLAFITSVFLFTLVLPFMQPGDMAQIPYRVTVGLLTFLLVFFLWEYFSFGALINMIYELRNNEIVVGIDYQKISSFNNDGKNYSIVRKVTPGHPKKMIIVNEEPVNNLRNGEYFTKKPNNYDKNIFDIVVVGPPLCLGVNT